MSFRRNWFQKPDMNSQPVLLHPALSQFFLLFLDLPFIRNNSHSSFQAFGFQDSSTKLSLTSLTTVLAWTKTWTQWGIQLRVFIKLSRVTFLWQNLRNLILAASWLLIHMDSQNSTQINAVSSSQCCLAFAGKTKASFTKARRLWNLRYVSLSTCPFSAVIFLPPRIISFKNVLALPVNFFWPTMRKVPKSSNKILNWTFSLQYLLSLLYVNQTPDHMYLILICQECFIYMEYCYHSVQHNYVGPPTEKHICIKNTRHPKCFGIHS